MREEQFVERGSVCEGDFIDGVDTVAESRARVNERERCRFFPNECPALRGEGPFCIVRTGHEVARYSIKLGNSVDEELKEFSDEAPMPPEGYFDPTIEEPSDGTTDWAEVTSRVGEWANKILGVQAIDSGSVNKEFRVSSEQAEQYPILETSVFDKETTSWIHTCGATLAEAEVRHPVRMKLMPLAGPGRVVTKKHPYCPNCEEEPNPQGDVVFIEDEDAAEAAQLRELGKRARGE